MSDHASIHGTGAARPLERLARGLTGPVLTERLNAVREVLDAAGARGWLVGGTVRDLLLGDESVADVDVVVDRESLAITRRLADAHGWAYVALDAERGTGRAVPPTGGHVDVNAMVGGTIEDDLAQRDLTINAMAVPLADDWDAALELVDPCGGLDDLTNQLARLTSEAAAVEDPLRMLRVFRFSTTLGFVIVPETLDAVATHAPLLSRVAPERVLAELALVLADNASAAVLGRMDEVGLLEPTLPEIAPMRGVVQNDFHHLDVLGHSLLTLDRLERLLADLPSVFGEHAEKVAAFLGEEIAGGRLRILAVKLAALLHDVGKPATRSTALGKTTFYHHNTEGAAIAIEACRRLRLSTAETDEVAFYVHGHMVPGDVEKGAFEADAGTAERSIVRFASRRGERGLVLALLAVADSMAMAGPLADPERPERLRRFARRAAAAYYDEVEPRAETPPLVTGTEIVERYGFEQGPWVGEVLRRLRDLQLEGRLGTREEALAEADAIVAKLPAERLGARPGAEPSAR